MASDQDTLRSKQNLKLLYAISEGELTEISEIYVNETAIKSISGDFAYTLGALDQPMIPYFEMVGGNTTAQVELTKVAGSLSSNDFSYNVEFVRVYFSFPSFYWHWHGADTPYHTTEFECEVWSGIGNNLTKKTLNYDHSQVTTKNVYKKGKSMGQYTLVVDVPRPDNITSTETWKIKLVRLTPDAVDGTDNQDFYANKSNVSFQEYYNTSSTNYAGTALLAVAIEDASRVNNQVPSIAAKGKGLKIKVPISTYYDSINRTYTGTSWNGTFDPIFKYTNNFAWCLYNIVSDSLTKIIPTSPVGTVPMTYEKIIIGCGVPEEYMAKYNFSKFASYCDDDVVTYGVKLNYISSIVYSGGLVTITTSVPHNITTAFGKLSLFNANNSTDLLNGFAGKGLIINNITTNTLTYSPVNTITGTINLANTSVFHYETEKRYSLNGQFLERKDADSFLNDILTIGNCYLAEIDGLVNVIYDYPLTTAEIEATPIFTNQNVDNGIFEYSDSNIADNHTQINITIQDKDNFNRTKTIAVFANDLKDWLNLHSQLPYYETNLASGLLRINYFEDKFSLNVLDITMQGTTSSAAAYRKGRSLLWDSLMNNEIVSFKTLLAGSNLYKGQVIRIADTDLMGSTGVKTGRITAFDLTSHTITLDREVTLLANTTYYLYLYTNESVVTKTLLTSTLLTNNTTITKTAGNHELKVALDISLVSVGDELVIEGSVVITDGTYTITSIDTINNVAICYLAKATISLSEYGIKVTKNIYTLQKKPTKFTIPNVTVDTTSNTLVIASVPSVLLDSIFVIKTTTFQTYKVISTTKDEDMYTTSCIRYDLNKFNYIDYSIYDTSANLAHIDYKTPDIASTINNTVVDIYASVSNTTDGKLSATITISWQDDITTFDILHKYYIEWTASNGTNDKKYIDGTKEYTFSVNIDSATSTVDFSFTLKYVSYTFWQGLGNDNGTPPINFNWTLDVPATIASTIIEH